MALSHIICTAAVLSVLFLSCSAVVITRRQSCLPAAGGRVSCAYSVPSIFLSTHVRGVCANDDYSCLCVRAFGYNNDIRGRHGKGPIKIGSISMLDNAVAHAGSLCGGPFVHQDLNTVTNNIMCDLFCSGENIAKFSGQEDDPAFKCMNMWENSPHHLENILRDNDYTVIGIVKSGDWTGCTQLFSLNGFGKGTNSGPKCAPVSSQGSTSAPSTSATTAAVTTSTYKASTAPKTMATTTAPKNMATTTTPKTMAATTAMPTLPPPTAYKTTVVAPASNTVPVTALAPATAATNIYASNYNAQTVFPSSWQNGFPYVALPGFQQGWNN